MRDDGDGWYLELATPLTAVMPARPRLLLGERVMGLGRDPAGDLVLTEDSVSWRHASVWLARGVVHVVDHGSTNGTWLDDQRVDRETTVRAGQTIRLGRQVTLHVGRLGEESLLADPGLRIEIAETGASLALPAAGIRLGRGADVDVSLSLAAGGWVHVRPAVDGVEFEGSNGAVVRARIGQAVEMCGLHLRVLAGTGPPIRTVGQPRPSDRYRLRVTLTGASGPEALLEDGERGLRHRIRGENRAVLLYVLASKLLADRAAQVPPDRQGWCTDEELATGVWGRSAAKMDANNLHVLIHRLRRELEDAGFDAEFIEKARHALRTDLMHVSRD